MRLELEGRSLEYRLTEAGSPPASLVFLHEGLGSIDLWRDFPTDVATASGRRGLAYNRFGHGWSDPEVAQRSNDYLHVEGLQVLPRVLESLSIARPVLIGHSDGASIALIHAGAGHRVSGLVLLAPHVFVEPESQFGLEKACRRFEETDFSDRLGGYHADAETLFRAWNGIWRDPDFAMWNIEASLPAISAPALIVQGLDDEYGGGRQVDAIAAQLGGPVSRLDVADAGHSPHLDQPEVTTQAVVEFLQHLG